jgi:hypothetical protein
MDCSRVCGEWFSIFTHFFWFGCWTVNLRKFHIFLILWMDMGYVVYSRVQIWFIIFGWLVLFSSSFRGIFLISLKGRGGCLSLLLVYSCSLVVCLFIFGSCMYLAWGSYCIVSVGFFFCVGLAGIIWSSKRYLGQQHRSHNRKNTLFSEQL